MHLAECSPGVGVALFVGMLGYCWARHVTIGVDADPAVVHDMQIGDDAFEAWLAEVEVALPPDAGGLVATAGPEYASSAACRLLNEATAMLTGATPADWRKIASLGQLLRRIVERGHGTEFSGGELVRAHSLMLAGLGYHLSDPFSSQSAYQRAARDYSGRGNSLLGSLAGLGAATSRWAALLDGERDEISTQLAALSSSDPEVAGQLGPSLDGYLRTLTCIAAIQAGSTSMPPDADAETVGLLGLAASASLDDVPRAVRLARAADDASAVLGDSGMTLAAVGTMLSRQRRWAEASPLLEECHARYPEDRDIAEQLADVWLETDRWDNARDLLAGLLASPPGRQDAWALQKLQNAAYLRRDPEYRRWQDLLATLDPSRTLAGQLPTSPAEAPREPLHAQFRKGKLRVSADFAGLSPEERRAHLLAAGIVAGAPGGRQKLEEFKTSEPAVAAHVMRLLGIESPTSPQVQARRHLTAGDEHFKRQRFEDAGREYQKAVDLDPDNALALLYLGDATYARGSYDLAQAYFGESLAIAPSPQAFRFLGDAIVHADGSLARARGCYEEALRLDPSYGGAKVALAQLHDLEREVRPRVTGRAPAGTALATSPPLGWSDAWTPPRPSASSRPRQAEDRENPAVSDPSDDPVGSAGDQLARMLADAEPHGAVASIDDDRAFSSWLAAASPDEITWAIMVVGSVAFKYMATDRDLARWAHWTSREVQLAEALPADFGPDQAPGIGRDRFVAEAYSGRARVLYSQGRLPEAREWLERAAALMDAEQDARKELGLSGESGFDRDFRTSDPRGEVLHNLAIVCRDLGDVATADQYAALASRAMEERPTTESLIAAAIEQGNAAIDRDPDTALSAFHKALDHAEEHPNQYTSKVLATSLNSLGRCHHRLGLHRSALEYFNRARRLNEQVRIAARLTDDFLGIGRVYRDRPDLGDAREALEQSLMNASIPAAASDELAWPASDGSTYRVTDAYRAWEPLLELGGLLEQRDFLADASTVLDVATRLADVARASAADDAHRIAIANQRIEAFGTLTRVHLRQALHSDATAGTAARMAWTANEAMRGRSFLDAIGDGEIALPAGIPPALAEQEVTARARRHELLSSGAHYIRFWEDLGQAQADLDSVWDRMLDTVPSSAGYVEVRRGRPAAPDAIQSMIANDLRPTVIASLMPLGPDQLAVIALRSDTAQPVIACQPADLPRMSRFITENMGTAGHVRELATDLEDLFHHEMEPLTRVLAEVSNPDEILIACPFGALNYVPLAALRVRGTNLAERNPLACLPTASLARALRMTPAAQPEVPAIVFGDPAGDLAGARAEATAVASIFGTTPVLGDGASRAAVRNALTRAGVVHVAAHSYFSAADPLSSGLRLSDGALAAKEIITLSAPALSLVTLFCVRDWRQRGQRCAGTAWVRSRLALRRSRFVGRQPVEGTGCGDRRDHVRFLRPALARHRQGGRTASSRVVRAGQVRHAL